jgi:hypothetical protein
MSRSTETMKMLKLLECWDNTMHTCPIPMTFPLKSSTSPHLPCHPPSNLPFPTTGCLKSPACKKVVLSPLSECYTDAQGSLSGFLSLIKSWCLWRSQILSRYVSFLVLHFPFSYNSSYNKEGSRWKMVLILLWFCLKWQLFSHDIFYQTPMHIKIGLKKRGALTVNLRGSDVLIKSNSSIFFFFSCIILFWWALKTHL